MGTLDPLRRLDVPCRPMRAIRQEAGFIVAAARLQHVRVAAGPGAMERDAAQQ
jgi:hypothetical protein